jgi:hypothetical protein
MKSNLEELWALSQHPEKFGLNTATVTIISSFLMLLLEDIPDAFENPPAVKLKPVKRSTTKRSRTTTRGSFHPVARFQFCVRHARRP